MYIYKLSRPKHLIETVDTCHGAIVVAADESSARMTYPYVEQGTTTWNGRGWGQDTSGNDMLWIHPDDVIVTLVGAALPGMEAGVLLANIQWG